MTPRPQKRQDLDRRIRNLESLDPGVFTGNTIASFQALPGLVGFWPMSSVQRSTGNVYDLSGQGRTLTYNGNPTFTYYNGLMPYIELDGTGDYFSRADETDLDILGSETIFTTGSRGLTVGGWFYNNADFAAGGTGLITKYNSAGATTGTFMLYGLTQTPTALVVNGTTATTRTSSVTVATGEWWFGVVRWVPSTSLDIFVNSTKTSNVTSIPATINNSTASLELGAFNGANNLYTGRMALCFLCANALGDELISSLYHQSRVLFGV